MTYIAGFVTAVPAANKAAYRDHAAAAAPLFKEFGVVRMVETWGDDVPDGKITDFKGAVKAMPDEVVVFSWLEFPSKAVADTAMGKMMKDPRMAELAAMPFDGQRMVFGGFSVLLDENDGKSGRMGYVDGSIIPVPVANKDAYRASAAQQIAVLREYGATRIVDAWGDDVRDGKVTDFRRAVKATADEAVVFSWIEWPSKQVRDAAWPKIFADVRMNQHVGSALFDAKRWVHGGFAPLFEV